jgi:cytochrome c
LCCQNQKIMKHLIGIVSLLALGACNNNQAPPPATGDSAATITKITDSSTASASAGTEHTGHPGYALLLQNDCKTCHTPDKPATGPSFVMIAARYDSTKSGTVEHLAQKVISGGKGSWGDVPMTPHPALSQADAETLVRYVLSYKQ